MQLTMLDVLRCPFCGTRLMVVEESPKVVVDGDLASGVLGCECCAYPVVAGIPVLVADDTTRTAMHQLEDGRGDEALVTLLGLEGDRAAEFAATLLRPEEMTYRSAIQILSPDPEGTYFLYRFSDPTYMMAQSVLQALTQKPSPLGEGYALDLCGGSGHLTRVLISQRRPASAVVLADVFFWKLWLARMFTAPGCSAVCCDANNPLPVDRATFRLVVLSDAFPYIWHKRLLADEMVRAVEPAGAIVMPHLHSSLGENFSAGMTLTPASYRELFEQIEPRLFSDAALLDGVLNGGIVDLGATVTPRDLGTAPSFTLIATHVAELFRKYDLPPNAGIRGQLRVNPLYEVNVTGSTSTLKLTFPTEEYEEEFGECKRYLPSQLTLPGDARDVVGPSIPPADIERLRRARVLIDAPPRYL